MRRSDEELLQLLGNTCSMLPRSLMMKWQIQFGSSVMMLLISLSRVLMSKSLIRLSGFMLARLLKIFALKVPRQVTDLQIRKQFKEFLVSLWWRWMNQTSSIKKQISSLTSNGTKESVSQQLLPWATCASLTLSFSPWFSKPSLLPVSVRP